MDTSSGPRSRPSGLWYGRSGTGAGAGQNSDPEPVPEPEHLNLATDGRDPRPEKALPPTFALLHRSSAPICTFAHLTSSCPRVLRPSRPRIRPTGQLINRSTNVESLCSTEPRSLRASHLSPCPRVPLPACPLRLRRCTFAQELRSDLHLCTGSSVLPQRASTGTRYSRAK